MVTHHPGVGGSLLWMVCFHELVPEPDVRLGRLPTRYAIAGTLFRQPPAEPGVQVSCAPGSPVSFKYRYFRDAL